MEHGVASTSRAIATLTEAFFRDPLTEFLLANVGTRARWLTLCMELLLGLSEKCGQVHTVDDDRGVLGVFPPGRYPYSLATGSALFARMVLRGLSPRFPVSAGVNFLKLTYQCDQRHIKEPHWYVLVIGVHPQRQGRGLSRQLFAPVLTQADHAGLPCYLENSNPKNLAVYSRFGFKVLDEIRPMERGPPLFLMRRDPVQPPGR